MRAARKTTCRELISALMLAATPLALATAILAPTLARADSAASPVDGPPARAGSRVGSRALRIRSQETAQNHRTVLISGRFLEKGRVALLNFVPVGPGRDGRFRARVRVTSHQTRIPVEVINAYGAVEERWALAIEPPPSTQPPARVLASLGSISLKESPPEKPSLLPTHWLTPSLGLSSISYQDSNGIGLSEYTLTAKLSYQQALGARNSSGSLPRWSLGLSGYYTAVPFSESGAPSPIRFLGLNAKVGYDLLSPASAWRLTLAAGAYYTTTFVSGDIYGFENMGGPELYPELQRALSGGGALSAYVKYAPILDQTQLSFSNTELAGGISYSPPSSRGHSSGAWVYSLDLSSLSLSQSGVTAQVKTVSLGIGLNL